MIGRKLSHFQILAEIGAGGMGTVYRSFDVRLERSVALKVLPERSAEESKARARFLREAQAASALNHPNIVTIYEIDTDGDIDFIAMELIEGRLLLDVIGPGLGLKPALRYGVQIADALAAAHEHGVIHRDLTPQNVMITERDEVKILDFGLAKRMVSAVSGPEAEVPTQVSPSVVSTAGAVIGTPQYMSPEQVQSQPVDGRSDLFSFGCVLYQMLTSRSPFVGESPIQVLTSILRDRPPPLRKLRPDVPEQLEAIVERALEKDVDRRYPSAHEMLRALRRLQEEILSGADSVPEISRTEVSPVPFVPPRGRGVQDEASTPTLHAVLTYSGRYREWVTILHQNLELCLQHAGQSGRVFLDLADLASGRSWVAQLHQLQGGLDDRGPHLILLVSPEALASPRVADEIEGFVAHHPEWARGRFHVVRLVDSPLPPFLDRVHYLDLRQYDQTAYRDALARLVAALLDRQPRKLPELPEEIEIPPPPHSTLPRELRRKMVSWLAPILDSNLYQRAIEFGLGLERMALDGHPSTACAASAALVRATGADDPLLAALRVADVLIEELGEDQPERVAKLKKLRAELATAQRPDEPEPGLIGVFLKKVINDHRRLVPYFQQRAELDLLDRVYVQLELRTERPTQLWKDEEAIRLHGPLNVRKLLALDPAEHPWITRRWVVLGDPGAGKTTLLRHLAATTAAESPVPWIPIFESLPRLMREMEWLLDRIARQLRRAGEASEGLPAVLDRAGQEGRLLLLLDGLDEVPRKDRDEAEALLRQLSERWPRAPILVTSRPIGYRSPGNDFHELELLPLDAARRLEFLARWLGRATGELATDRAEAVVGQLEEDLGLWELSGNPLYLTLMALLLEQENAPDRHRTRLYDQVFQLLLDGGHRPESEPMEAQSAVRQVLRRVAYDMTEVNRDTEPVIALESCLLQEELDRPRAELERVPRWHRSLRRFFEDLAERTGILGPHDGPDGDWRFWHRTFREALAAEFLESKLLREGESAILAHAKRIAGDESRWAEPYALLTGRIEKPDELVRALVKENRALGLRAVATAQGLRGETLDEILELSDDWKERHKVYKRIPELLGDPERALALIDKLRQRTRNGNDLYFLDLAIEEVPRRWSEYGPRAEQLRARLYDHIPAPREELFRKIETPEGGHVGLWREISTGRFLMGSPPVEEDRFANEGPRHEVSIRSSFCIAIVPVTVAQYAALDPDHEAFHKGIAPREDLRQHPSENVTWYAAISFCRWLSAVLPWARGARLPTEEEWEYACRAGIQTRYWSGDEESDLTRVGWYDKNSSSRTHRVAEKPANPWDLYDMHGNIWEWTLSPSTADYSGREGGITVDPASIDLADLAGAPGERRVIRGGSYWNVAHWARSAYRDVEDPSFGGRGQGFRVVLQCRPEP